jgi:hypothetical protein
MSPLARFILILMVALLLAVAGFDLFFHTKKTPPIGERLHDWARKYPVYASILAVLIGALLGHFFWQ